MKNSTPALLVLIALTLFAEGSSMAMSLGRHRGAVLTGSPLDISVQAVLDSPGDPAVQCIETDVFYANNKLDKSLIRVSTEKALSNPLDAIIRIRSSVPVNEPIVTLHVRVGCQQKTERRYVVMADAAFEPAAQPVAAPAAGVGASRPIPLVAGASSAAAPSSPAGASTPLAVAPSAAPSMRREPLRPAAVPPKGQELAAQSDQQRASASGEWGSSAVGVGNARLRLESLDSSVDRSLQLKPSMEILTGLATAGEPQRTAAAALWRALNAQPQAILQDADKIQSLETALSAERAQAEKNQLALVELNRQIDQLRAERYANWLVYALGMLLLLALAAAAYLWRQRTTASAAPTSDLPWWRKSQPSDTDVVQDLQQGSPPVSTSETEGNEYAAEVPGQQWVRDHDIGQDIGQEKKALPPALSGDRALDSSDSVFVEVRTLPELGAADLSLPAPSPQDVATRTPQAPRKVTAEELFDVQQQADFFVSLGQREQAVSVLRSHILDNAQTSPLVYMHLFNLYHRLDQRDDYEALRKNFNQLFAGKIPVFELYTDMSRGLAAYPVALTRIEAVWPSAKALAVIEESILRRPVANADAFDLEAYRELLLLYAVVKELTPSEPGPDPQSAPFDRPAVAAHDRTLQTPVLTATPVELPPKTTGAVAIEGAALALLPPSQRVGLDVDLNDPPQITEAPHTGGVQVNTSSRINSNFFARLGTKRPAAAAPHGPPASMIDFDAFEPPHNKPASTGAEKI